MTSENFGVSKVSRSNLPTYNFYNKKTKKEETHFLTLSELDTFIAENTHLQQCVSSPAIADPTRLGLKKPDGGFRDVLKRIKKASGRNNTINTW